MLRTGNGSGIHKGLLGREVDPERVKFAWK